MNSTEIEGTLITYDIGSKGGDYTVELTVSIKDGVTTVLDCVRCKYERSHDLLTSSFKRNLSNDSIKL